MIVNELRDDAERHRALPAGNPPHVDIRPRTHGLSRDHESLGARVFPRANRLRSQRELGQPPIPVDACGPDPI